MPCRYASSAPSAPSTGVQTLPQPRRDAMVIGERYVPDGRWKARWGSSHGEKCNRAITGTRLRKTMKYYPTHLDEGRGEMSRQGDDAEAKGGAAVPGPSSLPQESLAEKHTIQCLPPGPAPGTCPERRETESPFRRDDDANVAAFTRAPTIAALVIGLPVIRFHDRERMERLGICLQSVARDDCLEFPKRDSSSRLEATSRSPHAVRQKFAFRSGSWLWAVLVVAPPPQRPPGSAAGGLGRGNLAISRRAEGSGSGGSGGGSRPFVSTTSVPGEGFVG